MALNNETTPTHTPVIPRHEFPRPDFIREQWQCLNGLWEFDFDDGDTFENTPGFLERPFAKNITVPFCYQSSLSGIGDESSHPTVWYRRSFDCTLTGGRILLKFGAVDYHARVWVNGVYIGGHTGGYTEFSFDITALVKETGNTVVVKAVDHNETDKPRGKQSWTGGCFGCWYTPVSGIWQSVWLEQAGDIHFTRVKITPDLDNLQAVCEVFLSSKETVRVRAEMSFEMDGVKQDSPVCEITAVQGYGKCVFSFFDYSIRIHSLLWWPHAPHLIDVTVQTEGLHVNDRVTTYFGLRKLAVSNGRVLLNNHVLYQRLVLDQGYWPESLLTPPSDEAMIEDIKLIKAMGFNGARKHQKIEDPRFYYWADKMGLLVWGEMPSAYAFEDNAIANTTQEMISFIARDFNHPCLIAWVPLNESWGVDHIVASSQQQDYARMLYYLIKALDPTRLVSTNDGWEQVGESDICALHDYALFGDNLDKYADLEQVMNGYGLRRLPYAHGNTYQGEPLLMTEFGGIAFDNGEDGWGYFGKVRDEDAFFNRLEPVVNFLVKSGKFHGFCYTQLTDVMQEVNGLLTEQRKPKVSLDRLHGVFGKV